MQDVVSSSGLAERLFVNVGRIASRLPRVRGKTRLVLALYRILQLEQRHIRVKTLLHRPIEFHVVLDLHSWLQRVAFLTGGYEEDTVEFLLDLRNRDGRGGSFLDVGANIGLITIPLAKSMGCLGVVAVEAVPDNVVALQANIALNQMAELVRVVPQAVGATAGSVDIQVEGDLTAGEGTGTANILPHESAYECVRQSIGVTTIDELVENGQLLPNCTIVKIDTDGYDLKVLQGAVKFLSANRPVIFGEFAEHCLNWHGQSVADVASFAKGCGYQIWRRSRGWKFRPLADGVGFDQDLLLVPEERVRRFVGFLDE